MTFIIFIISAIYVDITGVINHLKGNNVDRNSIIVDGNYKDLTITFNGKITEIIYVFGLIVGAVCSNYSILFLAIMMLAQVPKKRIWWIVTDAVLSIAVLVLITVLHFPETSVEVINYLFK